MALALALLWGGAGVALPGRGGRVGGGTRGVSLGVMVLSSRPFLVALFGQALLWEGGGKPKSNIFQYFL